MVHGVRLDLQIALASVLNGGRTNLGWYGGRIYCLFARASC